MNIPNDTKQVRHAQIRYASRRDPLHGFLETVIIEWAPMARTAGPSHDPPARVRREGELVGPDPSSVRDEADLFHETHMQVADGLESSHGLRIAQAEDESVDAVVEWQALLPDLTIDFGDGRLPIMAVTPCRDTDARAQDSCSPSVAETAGVIDEVGVDLVAELTRELEEA